jgi:hypothetical protein
MDSTTGHLDAKTPKTQRVVAIALYQVLNLYGISECFKQISCSACSKNLVHDQNWIPKPTI